MKIDYLNLLSPENLSMSYVGTIKKHTLREIASVGYILYFSYINVLLLDVRKYYETINKIEEYDNLSSDEKAGISLFNLILKNDDLRQVVESALSFFIVEKVKYFKEFNGFLVFADKNSETPTGVINADNYGMLASFILQINCVSGNKQEAKKISKKAQELMDKIAKEKAKIAKTNKANDDFEIANIISAVCAKHNSINLINVWDLTVYQLYDQFQRLISLNITDVQAMNFSYYGGEFDVAGSWYKTINKK